MKASEEITEEQSRQVSNCPCSLLVTLAERFLQLLFDVDHAYAEFFRSLSGAKGDWT